MKIGFGAYHLRVHGEQKIVDVTLTSAHLKAIGIVAAEWRPV